MSEIEEELEPQPEVPEADQIEQAVPVPLDEDEEGLPLQDEPYDEPDPDDD